MLNPERNGCAVPSVTENWSLLTDSGSPCLFPCVGAEPPFGDSHAIPYRGVRIQNPVTIIYASGYSLFEGLSNPFSHRTHERKEECAQNVQHQDGDGKEAESLRRSLCHPSRRSPSGKSRYGAGCFCRLDRIPARSSSTVNLSRILCRSLV